MPDKRRACGNGCLRCWQNKMKHGNPESKKWLAKNPQDNLDFIWNPKYEIQGEIKEQIYLTSKEVKEIIRKIENGTSDGQFDPVKSK